MNKQIFAALGLNKTITFTLIKPFNCTLWHTIFSYKFAETLFQKNRIGRSQFLTEVVSKDNQQTVLRTKKNHPKDGRKNKTFIVLLYLTLDAFPKRKPNPLTFINPLLLD